jgi:cell division protein FtsA
VARRGGVAAIDVGTTKITALVGGYDDQGRLRVTGTGIAASHGIARGVVEDVTKASAAITAAVNAAKQAAGQPIEAATIGISGAHTAGINSRGTVALPNLHRAITREDLQRAVEGARSVPIPNNREIIQSVPRFYIVDGEESTGDPVGRFGHRLDVEAHIVTGAVTVMHNLTHCLESAEVEIENFVLGSVAAADAVLDDEERTHGVVLADIGGGTTDIAIFVEGSVLHTAVLPVGGNNITSDLVYGLRVPFRAADEIKEVYGHCIPAAVSPDETATVEAFGHDRQRSVNRRRACEIIEARVEEMLESIRDEVSKAGYEEMISAGIVLTGGTANLAGIVDVAERVMQMPSRAGYPGGVFNLHERLENPAFSASIGILGWAVREHDAVLRPTKSKRPSGKQPGGVWGKVTGMAKLVLPTQPSTRRRGDVEG